MIEILKNIVFVGGLVLAIATFGLNFIVKPAASEFVVEQIDKKVDQRIQSLEGNVGQLKLKTNETKLQLIELNAEQRIIKLQNEQILNLLRSRLVPVDGQ